MKKTDMLRAMNDIDDRYILEAAPSALKEKKRRSFRWQKALPFVFAAIMMTIIIPRISRPSDMQTENAASGAPMTECATEEEAQQMAGFAISVPDLSAYSDVTWTYYDEGMIEVSASENSNVITIRKAEGNEDISGDYNVYETEKQDNGITVRMREDKAYSAWWSDGTYSFSVSSSDGLDEDEMLALVSEIH
ncbi:MAG: hypothetical protein VZT48_09690 [Bulleidia sp.]|nr:hypothetical protein [Bulleidia sp.]